MREDGILVSRAVLYTPSPMFPLPPRGAGTPDVESLYGYALSLAGEHSLPMRTFLERLGALPAWRELGHSTGRYWDSRHGANLIGVCNVAKRWAELLKAATSLPLEHCTLGGLSRFVCGIGLVAPKPRVCLQCLASDVAAGKMPYERLWWRVSAARVCPLHRCHLVEPQCSVDVERPTTLRIPKRAGVCSSCGSVGHRCQPEQAPVAVTSTELWVGEQVRQVIAALPELAKADHRHMKDQIAHYCAAGDGQGSLARRANMAKSQMSYWLRNPNAKTSLGQLLDIALVEQFNVPQLLLGDLTKAAIPGRREPRRVKRRSRRVDHEALHWKMKAALLQGRKISEVAEEAGVDISTVARHEDLYMELRERTQSKIDSADTERRKAAVQEAETVVEILVSSGTTPSLRAASELTGTKWYPSQLRAQSLIMLRVKLGDRRVTVPPRMASSSYEYRNMLELSSRRLRDALGFLPSNAA